MTLTRIGSLLSLLLCFALAPTLGAFAQTTPAPVRDPQAVASLQSALAALGGAAQSAPTSIVASGTYTQFLANSTASYPLQVEALGFDKFRWQMVTPDQGTVVTIVSGATGWHQTSQETDGIPVGQIPGNTFETFPALSLALWANSTTVSVTMVGPETLAGETVLHISVTPTLVGNTDPNLEKIYESTHQREIFLDHQTFLPVRVRYYSHPTDWRVAIPIDLALSDFQPVNGLLFPFSITRYVNGQEVATIQYTSFTLNSTLSDSDFTAEVTQ